MSAAGKRTGVLFRLRHPRTTVRWRLTLLYGGLFFISGAVLLGAIIYSLAVQVNGANPRVAQVSAQGAVAALPRLALTGLPRSGAFRPAPPHVIVAGRRGPIAVGPGANVPAAAIYEVLKSRQGRIALLTVVRTQRISDLHQLVVESAIALAIMTLLCGALGWLVAGRVLRPLRTITATTQEISEANLHQRLAMPGPPDELRQLADTIDGLLERLESAFDAQRRFVANASHELRTPLTAARAMLEMVLTDPDATPETFRDTCRLVLDESEHQEQLIDALLALAQGQRGIERREVLDLAAIAREVLEAHELDAAARAITLDAALEQAPVSGDERLLERLVANLVENAIRHNVPDGNVRIRVLPRAGRATFAISNSGPLVPVAEVERLLQPFQRLAVERTGSGDGLGLGLSIVAAIADAHGALLHVSPGARGGLDVELVFPRAPAVTPAPAPGEHRELAGAPSASGARQD